MGFHGETQMKIFLSDIDTDLGVSSILVSSISESAYSKLCEDISSIMLCWNEDPGEL